MSHSTAFYCILCFVFLLLFNACNSDAPNPPPAPSVESEDSLAAPTTKEKPITETASETPLAAPEFEIATWMSLVDTVFPNDPNFDQLTDLVIEKQPKKFVMALNRNGLKSAQRYQSLWLLTYDSKAQARTAFNALLKLVEPILQKQKSMSDSRKGFKKFYETVYKGGALFLLKNNRILHRGLNCNDDYQSYATQEERITTYLNGSTEPETDSYFRFCCSCPPGQNISIK